LKAISGLQYDQVRIKVPPAARVELTLMNTDEMPHNWVMTRPNAREEVVDMSLELAKQGSTDYVPISDLVLEAIPMILPEEQYTISFRAPSQEGAYPYVCTYPGHGAVMYGAIYVTNNQLPLLATDENVPASRRNDEDVVEEKLPRHPYPDILPAMYRTFMPDSGPAGIAVGLLGDISYCWDAGQCRLRYAWKGGFINLEEHWSGKGKELAAIVGTVFYRDSTEFPFRIGEEQEIPTVEFLGYEMKNRYPTFKYRLDDVEVTERIVPVFENPGIKRVLTFSGLTEPLRFIKGQENVLYYSNRGEWEDEKTLRLSPEEAQEFTITITENMSEI
ncbi:MAG: plastocyanin/azurin family copper-binding protein, partial [Tunicatimonas sp.]|uniref:plastocyanin/azurin family copper-binding protein n=1 Tax=Tunicatimonas sp. TaxID=1940096 RepID=UPI003C77AEB9